MQLLFTTQLWNYYTNEKSDIFHLNKLIEICKQIHLLRNSLAYVHICFFIELKNE